MTDIPTSTGLLFLDSTSDPINSIGWVHRERDGDTPVTASEAVTLAPEYRDAIRDETEAVITAGRLDFGNDDHRDRAIHVLTRELRALSTTKTYRLTLTIAVDLGVYDPPDSWNWSDLIDHPTPITLEACEVIDDTQTKDTA